MPCCFGSNLQEYTDEFSEMVSFDFMMKLVTWDSFEYPIASAEEDLITILTVMYF